MNTILTRAIFFAVLYAAITLTVQVIFTGTIFVEYIAVPSIMMGLFVFFHRLLQEAGIINTNVVNKNK